MNKGRILEFFIIGLCMGVVEDIIAVAVSTGESITWNVLIVVTLVAIPFAIISELVVDHLKLFQKEK